MQSFVELEAALARAGFVGVHFDAVLAFRQGEEVLRQYFPDASSITAEESHAISQRTYFSVNVLALKHRFPAGVGSEPAGQKALYHGPAELFRLSAGNEFPRGTWVEVSPRTAWLLLQDPYRSGFTVMGSAGVEESPCCGLPGCC